MTPTRNEWLALAFAITLLAGVMGAATWYAATQADRPNESERVK